MTSDAGRPERARGRNAAIQVVVLAVLACGVLPQAGQAQFFWEQPRFSPDDAARVAMQHGYRVLARPMRNDDVYVAEVIDRRGARQQLIISTDNGRILQRLYVDAGRIYRPYRDPTIPPGPMPPARIQPEDRHSGFFARLFGGDDGDRTDLPPPQAEPPLYTPDQPVRPQRVRRPRLSEQVPETVHQTPVESEPLAPPSAAPRLSPPHQGVARPPVQANLPSAPDTAAPAPPPAPAGPVRSISRNPLAIPGSREQDEKAANAQARPASVSATPAPVVKPPTPPAAKDAVPVAPLE